MEKLTFFIQENLRLLIGIMVVFFVAIILVSIFLNKNTTTQVKINDQTIKVVVAKTDEEKQIGLSNTKKLDQDQGMLFVFNTPGFYSFWMKEMKFPIDIIYLNGNKVTTVIENAPTPSPDSALTIYQPKLKSDKVLEINAGMAKKYNIQEGTKLEINNL